MSGETRNDDETPANRADELVSAARKLPAVDPQRLRDDIDGIIDQSMDRTMHESRLLRSIERLEAGDGVEHHLLD